MKQRRLQMFLLSLVFLGVLAAPFGIDSVHAAAGITEFERVLKANGGFTVEEIESLRQGEPVSKLQQSKNDREVSVIGVSAFSRRFEDALETLQDVIRRQNKGSLVQMGNFGQVPAFADLEQLAIEETDLRDLGNCRVGKCSIKLDAAMIERFQREIDWNSSDKYQAAERLYKAMLVEYLQRYLTNGNKDLPEYRNEKTPLKLREDIESLQSGLLLLNEFAPEFGNFLRNFPADAPPNVDSSMTWSKIKFGLKPVIVITQTINYEIEKDGVAMILSVSRQLYASRYFDSSVGLSAFFRFPSGDGQSKSFLVYQNRSRSSALEGAFSSFKKEIVEREAISKLTPMLEDTRARLDYIPSETSDSDISPGVVGLLLNWAGQHIFWLIGGFLVLFVVARYVRRKPKR